MVVSPPLAIVAMNYRFIALLRRPEARAGMQAFLLKKPPPWAME
jgi:hypothetical protein